MKHALDKAETRSSLLNLQPSSRVNMLPRTGWTILVVCSPLGDVDHSLDLEKKRK